MEPCLRHRPSECMQQKGTSGDRQIRIKPYKRNIANVREWHNLTLCAEKGAKLLVLLVGHLAGGGGG